ncbi:TadE/TadG family type IV pilus assembly protein [Aurantiacibacter sediminis]|uniref:VWA domain-containing protein n=1 Tax=Aurantiacibacter sediminis TaxID=2793064 RepID=A0ABS0N3Y6_9SPHN|nr:Tad domain-containing protein [Aurantiacibacter sediminis]MBH5322684.1 VWA domain-containing protein [Aurantiacibacter sediminis]
MTKKFICLGDKSHAGVITRLSRDVSGNVMAIFAASLFPLIGLVGGGIDMGRGYLAQSRLQQACDAATLAARKRLGAGAAVSGEVPTDVAAAGQRFFNLNFQDGAYGTEDRTFVMTLEDDYAISGVATVKVPTTLMSVFGFDEVDVTVDCTSNLNFSDLDVMMVIDTTGSMRLTNPGDSENRIDSVRQVIQDFHTLIEAAKSPQAEVRYGFVPYSTNVNVGHLLADDWVAETWSYQSRERGEQERTVYTHYIDHTNWTYVSGERSETTEVRRYRATHYPGTPAAADTGDEENVGTDGYYRCEGGQPESTLQTTDEMLDERFETVTNPDGERRIQTWRRWHNGTRYSTRRQGQTCIVETSTDTNFVQTYEKIREPRWRTRRPWIYDQYSFDMSNWRNRTAGCVEERATYEILDYDNVDFNQALDLNIDMIPTPGDTDTQWRPMNPDAIYVRSIGNNGNGSITPERRTTTSDYADTGDWWFSACPTPARGLAEMSGDELRNYLRTLDPAGATYHDIGMIWGGRLLSPTGLFAAANADRDGVERSRHMIWLTDGATESYDIAYGAYGVDGLDRRRWNPETSVLSLDETVEARFSTACQQVKNRNIIVWVVAFGTELNPIMEQCGGPGRVFQASNAEELNDAFEAIARSMSELRVSS